MNILIVSSFLPYPLYSGGHIRLYNLIQRLSKKHTITLVCEMRAYQVKEDKEAVAKICQEVYAIPRGKQWSFDHILASGLSHHSFLITGHTHRAMSECVKELLQKKQFDLIHVETFYVRQNVPVSTVPILVVEHNIEYMIYERYVKKMPFFFRPFLSRDVEKIKREEQQVWKTTQQMVAVSDQDKKEMDSYAARVSVVSNGVDTSVFRMKNLNDRKKKPIQTILFIGDFSYIQNTDAAKFIIQEIFPRIQESSRLPSVRLWIKGRNIPPSIRALSAIKEIIYDDDTSMSTVDIFTQADVLLAPIRIGGGTQYKILEAMSCGTPVVTTFLGNEGINANEGKDILLGESAKELSEKVINVLTDYTLYETVAKNGRKRIEKDFEWNSIAKTLENIYQQVVKEKKYA